MIKLTQTIKIFSKVVGYKVNMQKTIVCIYTNNHLEDILNEKTPFTVTTKNMKFLGINLTRNDPQFYEKN